MVENMEISEKIIFGIIFVFVGLIITHQYTVGFGVGIIAVGMTCD